jgi:hypothetical protein
MGVNDRNRLVDGYLSTEGGIDSGQPASLIAKNRLTWAVNTVFRDGWPQARPGWAQRPIDFAGSAEIQTAFEDGLFQGAGTYRTDEGKAFLAVSVSGRIFTIAVTDGYRANEITIPGDQNLANEKHAWFQQAETWLVVQNGINPPLLFNGAGSRRAADNEVPVGTAMAYGKGRLWVARASQYFGGDLVYSDQTYGRDSVIRFTENTFLNEGGAFAVPDGPITGMAFAANLDTSLGDGDLLVSTLSNIHAFSAPIDRTVWKNMEQPLQRYAVRSFGAVNQESMVLVNGDVIYRAPDGIRSVQYSRRDFTMWGQTPISRQVIRALRYDTGEWLTEASGVNFDNRLLMTIQPQLDHAHGYWHRGLVSLDYHRVTGMADNLPPVWEGVWTGVRILRIITIEVNRCTRCYVFSLSDEGKIQLWEITKDDLFDRNALDDIQINWITESRGMTFERPSVLKRLMGCVQWFDRIAGEVSLQAFYRADDSECWHNWDRWSDCAEYRSCAATETCPEYPYGAVQPIKPFRSQFRPYIGLTQPPDVPEGQTGGLTRDGYEFQVRFECSGRFRQKRMILLADELAMDMWGDSRKVTCATEETGDCATGACPTVACCDKDDFLHLSDPPPTSDYPGCDGTSVLSLTFLADDGTNHVVECVLVDGRYNLRVNPEVSGESPLNSITFRCADGSDHVWKLVVVDGFYNMTTVQEPGGSNPVTGVTMECVDDGTMHVVECLSEDNFYNVAPRQAAGVCEDPGTGYPGSGYPGGGTGYPGSGGGGSTGGASGGGGDTGLPVYNVEDPSGPPPLTDSCDTGTVIHIESVYVWGLNSYNNPNSDLSAEQLACHVALHDLEVAANVESYENMGYTVTVISGKKWVYSGDYGNFYSMLRKSTCDPNDGIDDHVILFNGYQTISQAICVVPP